MDDIIRRFFGSRHFNPHDRPRDGFRSDRNDEDGDFFTDRGGFFGPHSGGLDDMFDHFHQDMFQQMESLHRQMEDMMKGFGAMDFPSADFSPPTISPNREGSENRLFIWSSPSPFFRHGPDYSKKNPRDFMLKDDEKEDTTSKIIPPGKEKDQEKPLFGLPEWGKHGADKMEDTDLDGKISEENMLELIKRPERDSTKDPSMHSQPRNRPHGVFSSQSISVSTFSGPDGKLEQKRVVRDSSGREESSVTRSIGDKSYTVTTITDDSGAQEKHEKLQNMDEGDLNRFEEMWSKPKQGGSKSPADSMLNPKLPSPSLIDPRDQNIFYRLFGRGGS